MRLRNATAAALVLGIFLPAVVWSLSASASSLDDPTPVATGGTTVSLTVDGTASPSPSTSPGVSSGGSTGAGTGGDSGGVPAGTTESGGTAAPICVPSATAPPLSHSPAENPSVLQLSPAITAQGSPLTITGTGFLPAEKIVVQLYPAPVKLGVFTADSTGKVSGRVVVPGSAQLGSHTVQAVGFQDCHVAAGPLSVVSPHGSGSSAFPWIVWAIAGGVLGIASIGLLIAFLLGWLPKGLVFAASAEAIR